MDVKELIQQLLDENKELQAQLKNMTASRDFLLNKERRDSDKLKENWALFLKVLLNGSEIRIIRDRIWEDPNGDSGMDTSIWGLVALLPSHEAVPLAGRCRFTDHLFTLLPGMDEEKVSKIFLLFGKEQEKRFFMAHQEGWGKEFEEIGRLVRNWEEK